jgi:molybdopterin biosynthesis enzyme
VLSEDAKSVMPLTDQEELSTLSDANAFIAVGEREISLLAGDEVTVVILERRYI